MYPKKMGISKSKTPEQMRSGKGEHVEPSSAAPKGTMSSSGTAGAKNAMSHGEREGHAKGVMGHGKHDY